MCRHLGSARGYSRLYDPAPLMKRVDHLSLTEISKIFMTSPRQVLRYRQGHSWLMFNTADRYAIAIDRLPSQIWPDFGEPCCEAATPRHGYGMYVHRRCRCDVCMEAQRVYSRDYYARKRRAT